MRWREQHEADFVNVSRANFRRQEARGCAQGACGGSLVASYQMRKLTANGRKACRLRVAIFSMRELVYGVL